MTLSKKLFIASILISSLCNASEQDRAWARAEVLKEKRRTRQLRSRKHSETELNERIESKLRSLEEKRAENNKTAQPTITKTEVRKKFVEQRKQRHLLRSRKNTETTAYSLENQEIEANKEEQWTSREIVYCITSCSVVLGVAIAGGILGLLACQ